MKLEFLTAEIGKTSWVHPVCDVYLKKLKPFAPSEISFLKTKKISRKNSEEARRDQSTLFAEKLSSSDYIILFDERGVEVDSHGFAKALQQGMESGKQRLLLVIGGPYGLDEELRQGCNKVIALSPLVLNQEVALTVALEQVYRGFTIINNLPYHNI